MLALQAHLIPRLPYPALRVDLLLPLMFAIAVEWSPLAGVLWAGFLGFVVDNFSGEFWGLHVGSYTVTVCLVNMASEEVRLAQPGLSDGFGRVVRSWPVHCAWAVFILCPNGCSGTHFHMDRPWHSNTSFSHNRALFDLSDVEPSKCDLAAERVGFEQR